jgi:polyketide synthase PksJ
MVLNADVADEAQMRAAVERIEERWGTVDGVLHAAGVPAGGLIQLKTRASAEEVFAPKVTGTLVLERIFANTTLDCFVVFSSIASILGAVGQVDYCAANAFLDAFAHDRARQGRRTIAINWDLWEEVGMAVKAREKWPMAPAVLLGRPQETPDSSKPDHVLFDTCHPEDGTDTYVSDFSPSRCWILNEHRLLGRPTLVGTSYLEMARAAYAPHAGDRAIELRDVVFLAPLSVPDGDRKEVHTVLQPSGEGYEFSIRSRSDSAAGGEAVWTDHAVGKLRATQTAGRTVHRIDEMLSRCTATRLTRLHKEEEPDTDTSKASARSAMSFGPRWKNLKYELRVGSDEAVAVVELPEEFAGDLEQYQLHPALLDVALSFTASGLASADGEGGFFLPFSYGTVKVSGPLGRKIYSHVRRRTDGSGSTDFITVDAIVMNDEGVELLAIETFTMKKVSSSVLQLLANRERQGNAPAESHANQPQITTAAAVDRGGQGIYPPEGVSAFRRVLSAGGGLPQVLVSTRNLAGRLAKSRATTQSGLLEKLEKKMRPPKARHARPAVKTAYVAPSNELEQAVADIWQTVLGIDKVGVHDGFLELGGNSLLGVQIVSRVRETFQLDLPLEAFFKAPTIKELGEAIAQKLIEQSDSEMLTQMLDEIENTTGDPGQAAAALNGRHVGTVEI